MKLSAVILVAGIGLAALGVYVTVAKEDRQVTVVHGLAWHNGLEEGLVAAKKVDRPVLLLSMFGRLDEEMPCANARTLRATLFRDPAFQALARDQVVLAWEMVRPVPKVSIDLGDGKKVVRTVRGNAVMYLCSPKGEVVDVYTGVWTPEDFVPLVREAVSRVGQGDLAAVKAWHASDSTPLPPRRTLTTLGKSFVESPALDLVGAPGIEGYVTGDARRADRQTALALRSGPVAPMSPHARFVAAASRLRDGSLTPGSAEEVARRTSLEGPNGRLPTEAEIRAEDSRRNKTYVRPVVHTWFASLDRLVTPAEARRDILGVLLKIPYDDPYLGLKDVLLPGTPE